MSCGMDGITAVQSLGRIPGAASFYLPRICKKRAWTAFFTRSEGFMLRLAAEGKKRLQWMIVLWTVAIVVVSYEFGFSGNTASAPATTATAPTKSAALQNFDQASVRLAPLAPQKAYEFGGRNIFRMQETAIEHKSSPTTPGPAKKPDLPPVETSTSIPIPFTFYGFAEKSHESRRVFLKDQERTFVVQKGDTVEGHYKVLEVSKNSVTIEDALQNGRQVIPLDQR